MRYNNLREMWNGQGFCGQIDAGFSHPLYYFYASRPVFTRRDGSHE
ncbi:hypothetical protein L21SP2_0786 [Salinispira pacifica]|uniref:Uncharacterized protein n=1 Tax=Salinispira pacifica TaxID=1307761 RepID=V5WEG7_9SPIO|nr:hypothetical protein L21SP2_0786 [Salinispira pacifica]